MIYVTLALVSPLYWVRSLRCGPAGRVALRWYASMVCVIWFGSFLIAEPTSTFYGWWLSLAGSATMCLAAFAEARVLSAQSVVATLASLVTCRLALRSLDEPYCTKCGYLLVGLTLPRCPECGQAFPIDMATNAAPP
ncbi:MAG: hypothetical protein ACE5GE_00685 [Phycisphaerae bacterium]